MGAKSTSVHRPEFAQYVGVQPSLIGGLRRFHFTVPSGSDKQGGAYRYWVNEDGSRPTCTCLDNEFVKRCRLCEPDTARAMADRALAIERGESVAVGF